MRQIRRYVLAAVAVMIVSGMAMAQTTKWKEIHKVKKKETIFGIARDNGLTVDELIAANPEMTKPGYELKKGTTIFIPFPSGPDKTLTAGQTAKTAQAGDKAGAAKGRDDADMRRREIRVGVMLPLHDINGDGRRMVEYYRGVLMACDSLRQGGISVDVRAWNVPEEAEDGHLLR